MIHFSHINSGFSSPPPSNHPFTTLRWRLTKHLGPFQDHICSPTVDLGINILIGLAIGNILHVEHNGKRVSEHTFYAKKFVYTHKQTPHYFLTHSKLSKEHKRSPPLILPKASFIWAAGRFTKPLSQLTASTRVVCYNLSTFKSFTSLGFLSPKK